MGQTWEHLKITEILELIKTLRWDSVQQAKGCQISTWPD